jgi:hypothetical protein
MAMTSFIDGMPVTTGSKRVDLLVPNVMMIALWQYHSPSFLAGLSREWICRFLSHADIESLAGEHVSRMQLVWGGGVWLQRGALCWKARKRQNDRARANFHSKSD